MFLAKAAFQGRRAIDQPDHPRHFWARLTGYFRCSNPPPLCDAARLNNGKGRLGHWNRPEDLSLVSLKKEGPPSCAKGRAFAFVLPTQQGEGPDWRACNPLLSRCIVNVSKFSLVRNDLIQELRRSRSLRVSGHRSEYVTCRGNARKMTLELDAALRAFGLLADLGRLP
jgi:hypothetical protein